MEGEARERDVINFSYRLGTSAFGRLRSATPLIISGSSFFLLVSSTLRLTCPLAVSVPLSLEHRAASSSGAST